MKNGKRLLFIQDLFYTYSDKEHSLSITRIINILRLNGVNVCRNTVMEDIHTLQDAGMNIQVYNNAYRLVERTFEISEIQIIVSAIAAFKFLTIEKIKMLIEKVKDLCSKYEAENLQREFHITNRVKTDNPQVMENINIISKAIKEDKQFKFDYYDYDTENNMVYNGTRQCSPWEMAISAEEYYAVTYYLKYPESLTNFRIDRMKNIRIVDCGRIKPPKEIDIGKYLKSSFCMFSGVEEYVTLRFPMENKMCNVVYDKFGHDTILYKYGEFFEIHVPIKTKQPKAFFSWLALFEGEVQILKPLSLAEEFLKRMKHLVETINDTIDEIEKNHRISSENNSVDTR